MSELREYLKRVTRPKYTVAELAARLKVHKSLITMWRSGARKPGRDKLKQLAKLSGIKIEDLL